MRKMLFRGQTRRKGEKVWMDGSPVESNWVYGGIFQGRNISVIYGYDPIEKHCVYSDTVGQFTGLTDKNGKKIFEGDIVEYNDGFDHFKGEVVFENGAFGIGSYEVIGISSGCCDNFVNLWQLFWDQEVLGDPELYCCNVIGNIHDNPELLEVE